MNDLNRSHESVNNLTRFSFGDIEDVLISYLLEVHWKKVTEDFCCKNALPIIDSLSLTYAWLRMAKFRTTRASSLDDQF